ncbi:MAG: 8-amino-7-oxononanoate synthase, partial [Pseudomonadota bacterium]
MTTQAEPEDRAALIGRLRAAHRMRAGSGTIGPTDRTSPRQATGPKAFDFASLPRAKTLSMQHAAMETVGLSNPFFRVHDGAPGPEPVISGAP